MFGWDGWCTAVVVIEVVASALALLNLARN